MKHRDCQTTFRKKKVQLYAVYKKCTLNTKVQVG